MSTPRSQWKKIDEYEEWDINGKECVIRLVPRPHYCDRGNWLAHLEAGGILARDLDWQDGWPRYYMDLERAKLEIEDWLKKRGQWL